MTKKLSVRLTAYIVITLIVITVVFVPLYLMVQKPLYIHLEKSDIAAFAQGLERCSFKKNSSDIENFEEKNNVNNYVVSIRNEKFKLIYSNASYEKYNKRYRYKDPDANKTTTDHEISRYSKNAVAEHYVSDDGHFEKISLRNCIDKNGKTYYIYISLDLRAIDSFFSFSNDVLVKVLVAYIAVCAVILFVLINKAIGPVSKLTNVTERIAHSDYNVRYNGRITKDEIGTLASNINEMADTIQENISSLSNYNFLLKEDLNYMSEYENMRQRVVCNITHELKTPLAIISSQIEMMNLSRDDDKKAFYYSSAMDEVDKMSKLISRLLNYSVRDRDIFSDEVRSVNLSREIEALLNKSESYIVSKKIKLKTEIEDVGMLTLSQNHIEHVFNNYISNAVSHTKPGGKIKVRLTRRGEVARLSVYNDGVTIDNSLKDSIWTEAFTSNKNLTDSNMHMGLGLFIVKEISVIDHTVCGFINHSGGVEFWFDFISGKTTA